MSGLFLGAGAIAAGKLRIGSAAVSKIMLGAKQVWPAIPAGFDPLTLAPTAWWDAADASTVTIENDFVSMWADKSGNGNHARNGTPERRPKYNPAHPIANNKPALFNTNASSVLTTQQVAGTSSPVLAKEVFVVAAFKDGVANIFNAANALPGGGDGYIALFGGNGDANGAPRQMGNINSGIFLNAGAFGVATEGRATGGGYRNRDTSSIGNGTGQPVLPMPLCVMRFSAASPQSFVRYLMGATVNNGNRGWNGPFCECLMFGTNLPVADREALVDHLMTKWGIAG